MGGSLPRFPSCEGQGESASASTMTATGNKVDLGVLMAAHPWLALALAVLATWRVTHLLAREDGPFKLLARLRVWVGTGFFASLMDCFACLSLWTAAPLAWLLASDGRTWVVLWLGFSGAALLLERLVED